MGWRGRGGDRKLVTVSLSCSLNCQLGPFLACGLSLSDLSPFMWNSFLFLSSALQLFFFSVSCPRVSPFSLPYIPSHTVSFSHHKGLLQTFDRSWDLCLLVTLWTLLYVVMPLKRVLQDALQSDTRAHTPQNLSHSFSHFTSRTPEHRHNRTQMWRVRTRALRLFVLTSDTVAPVFVCNFHWPQSTPLNPWEFVDQHLLKKLQGMRVYNWAKTECNECSEVVIFMWYFWCVLCTIVYSGGWQKKERGTSGNRV